MAGLNDVMGSEYTLGNYKGAMSDQADQTMGRLRSPTPVAGGLVPPSSNRVLPGSNKAPSTSSSYMGASQPQALANQSTQRLQGQETSQATSQQKPGVWPVRVGSGKQQTFRSAVPEISPQDGYSMAAPQGPGTRIRNAALGESGAYTSVSGRQVKPEVRDTASDVPVADSDVSKVQGRMEQWRKNIGPAGWPGTAQPNMQAVITPQFETGLGAPQSQGPQSQGPQSQGFQPSLTGDERPALDPYRPAQTHSERLAPLVDQVMLGKSTTPEGLRSRDALLKEIAKLDQQSGINQGLDSLVADPQQLDNYLKNGGPDPRGQQQSRSSLNERTMPTEYSPIRDEQLQQGRSTGILYTDKNSRGEPVPGQMGKYDAKGLVDSPVNRGGYSQNEQKERGGYQPYVQSAESIGKGFSQSDGKGGQIQYGAGGLVQPGAQKQDPAYDKLVSYYSGIVQGGGFGAAQAAKDLGDLMITRESNRNTAELSRQSREDTLEFQRERLAETKDYHQGLAGSAAAAKEAAAEAAADKRSDKYNTTLNGMYSRLPKEDQENFSEIEQAVANSGAFKSAVLTDPQAAQAIFSQAAAQIRAAKAHNKFHPLRPGSWFDYVTEPRWSENSYNPSLGTPVPQTSIVSDDNAGKDDKGRDGYVNTYRKAAGISQ